MDQIVEIVSKGKRPMPAYAIKSKALGLSPDEISEISKPFENLPIPICLPGQFKM